jgi:hypothetical protein
VLRRIFGPVRDGVTEKWRKLNNEELNDLYSSLNIIFMTTLRKRRWVGHARERRGDYRVLVGEPVGKKLPGRCRHRWESNIKKWDVGVWTGLIWRRIGTGGGLF